MVRTLTSLLIFTVVLAGCDSNSRNKNLQGPSVSFSDSLIVDSLMNYCYHFGYYNKGTLPVQGTAFYVTCNFKVYLFSALHNFTGTDPETGELIRGLSNRPFHIWVWQSFNDRKDWWANYDLYRNKNALFIGGSKDANEKHYDICAYKLNDSTPYPKYILDYNNKKWASEDISVGDTVFYCAYPLIGNQQSKIPRMYIGRIKTTPSSNIVYITSEIFGRPGSSGAPVFKLSDHKLSLVGLIARGNSSENIVYITPFKEGFAFLGL
jgi:hypothetical protein